MFTKILIKITFITLLYTSCLFCIELPARRFNIDQAIFLFDAGRDWDKNSVFGLNHLLINKIKSLDKFNEHSLDSLIKNSSVGLKITKSKDVEFFGHFILKHKNFYSYLNPRIVTNHKAFNGYTGIPRNTSRYGFNSGETNFSGFGFKNENVLFQIGRGRESWSAGNGIDLVLSKNSPSYDYFKFLYEQNNFRFIYFHGFLENIENYNRYITGKGLEIKNNKSMILGFSEIIIYSGYNRPIDFAYFNPTSSHLEIELNDRQNLLGPDDANAVWQLSLDYLIKSNIRFSSNFIIDELTIDKVELDSGKVSGIGLSSRLSYFKKFNNHLITLYGKYIYVGTHTFRHTHGYNNFIQRGLPLGWKFGSDGYSFAIGCNYFNTNNIIVTANVSKNLIGASTVYKSQYETFTNNYKDGPFPSGIIDEISLIDIKFQYKYDSKTNFYLDFISENNKTSNLKREINIGFFKDIF